MFYVEHFIKRKGTAHCSAVPFRFMLSEFQNTPEIKISRPMPMRMMPPRMDALPESLVPNFLPMRSHQPAVFRNGKADGKSINAGSHALHEQCTRTQLCCFFGLFALDAIHQHFAADVAQQSQRDPRDELFKRREQLHNGVHAHPACHGHHGLKKGKGARDPAHGSPAHAGVVQAVCHRHRERIHGKAHAQQGTVEEKYNAPFHIVCLLNLTRISGNTKPGHGRTCTSGTG